MSGSAQSFELAPVDFSDVRPGENSFRWWVRSRTNPKKEYLVDVSSYGGHGKCTCPDFEKRFEKFLSRAVKPEEALAMFPEQVERRPYHLGENDVLRCWHLMRALSKLSAAFVERARAAMEAKE